MGAVKVDIHKNEYEWYPVNLSTKESVKGLLKYRNQYDLLLNRGSALELNVTNVDLNQYVKEVLCLYADLDYCISKANLSDKHHKIIQMLVDGYTEREIGLYFKQSQQSINNIINTICKNISNVSKELWFLKVYKREMKGNMKLCNQCSKEYPSTNRYFGKHSSTKDKLDNVCKSCKSKQTGAKKE